MRPGRIRTDVSTLNRCLYAVRRATAAVRPANCFLTGAPRTCPEVTHRFVRANGLRFHLAEAGGHGPAVLLLHGFPQHWYAWRHVMAALAADHRVYAPDLRGAGPCDAPRRGYDSATLPATYWPSRTRSVCRSCS